MRITLDVDGRPTVVEVDLHAGTVQIGERRFSAKIVADSPARIELEIDGEKVSVEGWRPGEPSPSEPVAVDGERFLVRASVGPAERGPQEPARPAISTASAAAPRPADVGEGTEITPPMPGKVVEIRVRDGETVRAGQVLLVLEAMKMRNEVTAPIAGVVRSLRVVAGANVRAREAMLRIAPA
jgi:glutaconyl-CoA/methylmalonyl-CoA decarboxylase subunit gamma